MKYISFLLVLLLVVHLFAAETTPKQMILKTDSTLESKTSFQNEEINQYLQSFSVKNIKSILPQLGNYFLVEVDKKIDWQQLQNAKPAAVESIQPNYLNQMLLTPNDTRYDEQLEYLQNINLPAAWNYSTGNGEILVGIVDSGIHFDHPDLNENIFINEAEIPDNGIDDDGNSYVDDWHGWDFTDASELGYMASGDYLEQDNDPTDEYNHGTHVAGIIAADTNNNFGISGVSWNNKVLPVRAGFKTADGVSGYLQDDDAAAGIIYCADMGADIINCSWGSDSFSQIIADACQYAYSKGSILVVSSGNTGQSGVWYPAHLSSTIAVGAVDNNNERAIFSTFGPHLDLVAPGVNILSTYATTEDNYFSTQSGTSMAAPIVSSAISLLLSINSDLTFQEVLNHLTNSCVDLGDNNFDNYYGNGLLDVYTLLTTFNQLEIDISSPAENAYLKDDVEIIGTANCQNFWRYSVAYTTEQNPSSLDWFDVDTHQNTPQYYYEPKENETLASFDLPNIETRYTLRLDMVTTDNQHHYFMKDVYVDKTAPQLYGAYFMKRYKAEKPLYFLQTVFDDKINLELQVQFAQQSYVIHNNVADSILVLPLPENIPQGSCNVNVTATNLSGLENSWNNVLSFYTATETIGVNSYTTQNLDNELKLVDHAIDFNGDDTAAEFIATEIAGASQTNRIFQLQNNELSTLYSFADIFYPLDITSNWAGNKTLSLGISSNEGVLYRVFTTGNNYADSLYWSTGQVYGGAFIDYDLDGTDELALIKNKTINNVTKRVIMLYDENLEEMDYLLNETPTYQRNEFIALKCADLNNDGQAEILTADKDGDIMIFEKIDDKFTMTWHSKLPVQNSYYLDINDYNGDGQLEFCAGGYYQNDTDMNKTFSYFAVFGINENEIELIDYLSFTEVLQKNSLTSGDMDGDGDQELIIAVTPNIYIADLQAGQLTPMWQGEANSIENNSILCLENTNSIIVNKGYGDDYYSILIQPANFTGPATPHNFSLRPLNATQVELNWQSGHSVKVYRKFKDEIQEITEIEADSYIDSSFTSLPHYTVGDTLYYSLSAYDEQQLPPESLPTNWKRAIPFPQPILQQIIMSAANELKIIFTSQLANSALDCGNYNVNNQVGKPASINFISQQKGLLLSFQQPFADLANYSLQISSLEGRTGVLQHGLEFSFQYQQDVTGPKLTEAEVVETNTVRLYFNEALDETTVENLANYSMVMPSIDWNNELETVEYSAMDADYTILLHMQKPLQYSNQAYFVKLENIKDLSGNVIQNDGNKTHFRLTDIEDLNHLIVYPNPFNTNKYEHISFANLPLEKPGKIWIYELDGGLVFKDKIDELSVLENVYRWDGRNSSGAKVASGLYIFVLNIGDDYKRGKIAVVH
jgi:subtilisin family serine protease